MILIQIIGWWYHFFLLPTVTNPYYYILFFVWVVIVGLFVCLFFYTHDRNRMQYLYKDIGISLIKSAGISLLAATIILALYNYVLYLTASSLFFKNHSNLFSLLFAMSSIVERRIITGLFLLLSFFFSMHYLSVHCYQLQDDRNWTICALLVLIGSVLCYGICMKLGYV